MSPTVVVMLPAADAAAADTRALVTACTAALRTGQCVIGDGSDSATAIAVATVAFGANGRVRIEVDVRASESLPARHPVRELVFHEADPIEERWKSVGFAVAGLSGGAVEPSPEPPEEAPPEAAVVPVKSPKPGPKATPSDLRPSDEEGEHPLRASARIETGPGLTRGTWRLGGALGAGYDFDDGFWGIDVHASYAANPATVRGVDVSWLTVAAGASVAWTLFDVEGRLGALLGARDVHATESDAASGDQQSRSRWLPVGIVHASARWPASALLGILSGVELRRASGGTAVESHGAYIGSSSALDFGLFLGVEVRP
jgi:hypothetical protein